jgi:hypothetical protein
MDNTESVTTSVIEPKLWAGKYKTPEEMEEALIGKDKEYGKLYTEHGEIKKQFESKTMVPEKYDVPSDLSLRRTDIDEIEQIARNAGLNQEQFEKTARDMHARIQSNLNSIEESKKTIGQDKLNIVSDHIKKHYPESLHTAVLNQVLRDQNALNDILKERETKLNSEVPGMDRGSSSTPPPKFDGQEELEKAHKAYHKRPSEQTRKKYIDLARQVGEDRYKDKI